MLASSMISKNNKVILVEKNEKLGKKLYITGKGRCNVTNDCAPREFLENVVTNAKFMQSAIYGFTSEDTMVPKFLFMFLIFTDGLIRATTIPYTVLHIV